MSEAAPVVTMAVPPPKGKGPPPKGLGKGVPPAPMPGKGPAMLPRGAMQQVSGPKLRPLFWTTVSQMPAECVWADIMPAAPFDKALLERQFALADSRTPSSTKAGSGAPGSRTASEEPRKRLRVLDDRTSQLLAIAFNRLPPPERVAEIVDACEDFPDGLTPEAVLALHNAVSEHGEAVEQIRMVATNPETIALLDMPERFLLRLSAVEFCNVKLSCGALIVGSAKELMDLRLSGQKVGVCCQELRKSRLLQKCMSTALAVGNFLNRGTARSGVRGVVLPESLLKLEELRGGSAGDLFVDFDKEKNGGSLLDFVAQAIVNEDGVKEDELRKEAENLLAKARSAAGVSLEETQASCRQINAEATKAQASLEEVPPSAGVSKMAQRVKRICEEAALAVDIAEKAQEQLSKTQQWSCFKGKAKSNDWFASWVQFLDLLPRALGRAQEAKARRLAQEEAEQRALKQRPPLSDVNAVVEPMELDPFIRKSQAQRILDAPVVQAALATNPRVGQEAPSQMQPEANETKERTSKAKPKIFDDEARIDNIDWSKLHAMRQETTFDDKENSLH